MRRVTVDVLAEISANEVPIGKTIGAQHSEPNRHVIRVNEPDHALGEPEQPSRGTCRRRNISAAHGQEDGGSMS